MITVETIGSSSRGNCYRLLSGGRSLLLECGLPWAQIRSALKFQTTSLDGCLVTHNHKDHCRSAADVMRAGIDLYATRAAFDAMDIAMPQHRFHPLYYRLTISIGERWRVMPFEARHDAPGAVGFWITDTSDDDKLVFLTDSAFTYYTFPGTNVYMVEANHSEAILQRNVKVGLIHADRARRISENHMSIDRVVEMLKSNDLSSCRAIHLLHGSDGNSDSEQFKRLVEEATGIPTRVEG